MQSLNEQEDKSRNWGQQTSDLKMLNGVEDGILHNGFLMFPLFINNLQLNHYPQETYNNYGYYQKLRLVPAVENYYGHNVVTWKCIFEKMHYTPLRSFN